MRQLTGEIANLFVQTPNLEVPLYGEELGLGSIDILDVALIVSKQPDIQFGADASENQRTFRS